MLTIALLYSQFVHGQTYQAHPMVCAASLEVLRIFQEENLIARAKDMGNLLEAKLKEAFGNHPHVGNIRGRGLFWAVSALTTSFELA
jgi:adenosylmethionine-8-amino-7-oxononanoate aminotransferase